MLTEFYSIPLMRLDAANHQLTREYGAVGLWIWPTAFRLCVGSFKKLHGEVYFGIHRFEKSLEVSPPIKPPHLVVLLFSVPSHLGIVMTFSNTVTPQWPAS